MTTRKPQFFILLLLISFASVGAVLFTPALPAIASFFGISAETAQLTITVYLIGYALGQLPYGPLANRLGRKKTLYIGISLAIVGSLLCAFSGAIHSFPVLIFARFLQALGASVGLKITFTMIADVYEQSAATKLISHMVIAFAVMPGLSVVLGGYLTQLLGWEGCFYFLALFGILIFWMATLLPETAKSLNPNALNFRVIINGYIAKFKNTQLVISGALMGCGSALIYIFAAKAPFIAINLIGLSPKTFGIYNLIPLLGMLLGAIISGRISGKVPLMPLLFIAISVLLAVTFGMFIIFLMGIITPLTLFFPMLLILIANAIIFPNISSFGLSKAQNKSNGSAILNFINLTTTVIAVFLSEFFYPESTLLLPISFLVFEGLMLLLWLRLKTYRSHIL